MTKRDGGWLLPSVIDPARVCVQISVPKDREHIAAFVGTLLELTKWWNWQRDDEHLGIQAAMVWQEILQPLAGTISDANPLDDETCFVVVPEPGEKLVFFPDASLISYAPQDPFAAPDAVPPGYVFPPFYVLDAGTFPGTQPGDVLTDLTKLPTAWPPLLPPDGYPRFRVSFHVAGPGPGEVELHMVKLPTAGLALVTLDGSPATADFIDLSTADVLDVADLGALLGTVLDGDLVRTHIQELHISEPGDHFIDVTFLPKIGTSSLIGFGGGLRQVVLGGTAEAGTMPAPQFRLNGEILEWRPNEAHVWLALGDVVVQGPPGEPGAPGEDANGISATQLTIASSPGSPSYLVYNLPEQRLELTLGAYFSQLQRTGASEFSAWGDTGFEDRASIDIAEMIPSMFWRMEGATLVINAPGGGTYTVAVIPGLIEYLTTEIFGGNPRIKFKRNIDEVEQTRILPWHLNFVQTLPDDEDSPDFPNTFQLQKFTDDNFLRLKYPAQFIARIRQFSEIPGRLQYQNVNDTAWYNLIDVPPFPGETVVEPVPDATDEAEAACLAAMNAARVIGATYEDLYAQVGTSLFANPVILAQWLIDTALGVVSGSSPQKIMSDVALILAFITEQGGISSLPWSTALEEQLRCVLLDNATVTAAFEVAFDYDAVLADVTSLIPGDASFSFVRYLVRWMDAASLATAGKVAYFSVPDCGC